MTSHAQINVGTSRAAARLTAALAGLAGLLVLVAPAFASAPPSFNHEHLHLIVRSTRVSIEGELDNGQLATEFKAEYAESEGGPWTVVNSETVPGGAHVAEHVTIGAQDPGETLVIEPIALRHLKPGTSYFARFVAKNADGEAVETIPFKTPAVAKPEVPREEQHEFADNGLPRFVLAPSGVTSTTAGFRAKLETNGAQTEYSFEYAESAGGPWKPFTSGAGTVTVAEDFARVEASVSGLAPETTYFVRLSARNSAGAIEQTEYVGQRNELMSTFTTRTAKAVVEKPDFRNVTADAAHVSSFVNPHGSETRWRLEYAPSAVGPWSTVPGGEGTISQAQAEAEPYFNAFQVAARLTGLTPSTTYYVRMFAENAAGEGEWCGGDGVCEPVSSETRGVGSFTTSGAPSVLTSAVHALHGEALRLLGSVDPNSLPTSAEQTVTLEGAPTGGSFTLTFRGQTTEPIAFDADGESVRRALAGLPGEPHVLVQGAAGGPYTVLFVGLDGGVSEPPIEADGSGLTGPGPAGVSVATLYQGGEAYDTHYRFQYVSERAFAEGGWAAAQETPEVDAGSGVTGEFVGLDLPAGLEVGETYRYRIVASNTAPGTSVVEGAEESLTVPAPPSPEPPPACANEAFRTGLSAHLPDCRAYELLTPADKEGAQEPFKYAFTTGTAALAGEDGEHLVLDAPDVSWGSGGQTPYFFSREQGRDWRMTSGAPQPQTGPYRVLPQLYSADLTQLAFASDYDSSAIGQSPTVEYKLGPAGGPYTTVASVPRAQVGIGGGWAASSADFSKLVLQTEDRTLSGEPTGTQSGFDLYEYTADTGLRQLNVSSAGATIGSCGARIADGQEEGANLHAVSGPHSVSADGSRVLFEAIPGNDCSAPSHLYMRVGGAETVDIGACRFLAANADASRLLLERLNGEAHEGLLYDTETAAITPLLSTRTRLVDEGLLVSDDLSAFYLDTAEQLTSGVSQPASDQQGYLYRYDIPTKTLEFLFQYDGFERTSLSPDGRYAYFSARGVSGLPGGAIDPGHLSGTEPVTEVYRYDSAEHLVQCISCASTLAPEPKLGSYLQSADGQPSAIAGGLPLLTTFSASGDYAFFTTPAALVKQDVDGETPVETQLHNEGEFLDVGSTTSPSSDIYEWRRAGVDGCAQAQGCLALITDGLGGYMNLLLGSAHEGRDVYVYTRSKLLSQDQDTSGDIYDVRVGGGLPGPPPRPVECEGDACSTPLSPPNDSTPSSLTFTGLGNLTPLAPPPAKPPAKCAKGKKLVKDRKIHRVKCVKTRKSHGHNAKARRKASRRA